MIISHFPGGGSIIKELPEFSYTGDMTVLSNDKDGWVVALLTSGEFTSPINVSIDIFGVGGGGGGAPGIYLNDYNVAGDGDSSGGGGGGGGFTTTIRNVSISKGETIAVEIGAGGAVGTDGGDTKFGIYMTANGGKKGHQLVSAPFDGQCKGGDGGSGGGSGSCGPERTAAVYSAGNGGSDGSNGAGSNPGIGQGTTTRAFGEPTGKLYAGGGAGGNHETLTGYYGGDGGGGDGAYGWSGEYAVATPGDPNTGGGGGGGAITYANENSAKAAAPGGSGIVLIRNARG